MMLLHARQRVLVYLDCFSERGHILFSSVEPRQSCIHGGSRPKSFSLQHPRSSAQICVQRLAFPAVPSLSSHMPMLCRKAI